MTSLKISNEYGSIELKESMIASVVGLATVECFGVVGMASRHQIRDGFAQVLGSENFSKGIEIKVSEDELSIDIYVILAAGIKISEVTTSIQKTVKYNVENTLGLRISKVNIFVQGIKATHHNV